MRKYLNITNPYKFHIILLIGEEKGIEKIPSSFSTEFLNYYWI
jgi:hypothetical protein